MTETRAPHRALLLTGGLVLALVTGCAAADDTAGSVRDTAAAPSSPTTAGAPSPTTAGPSSPPPALSEVPGSASPVPTRALPRPSQPPQGATDVVKARTITGELTVRPDGCRVLRDPNGTAYLLRGDAAAGMQAGPTSLRGHVQVLDDAPCPGLSLVLGG